MAGIKTLKGLPIVECRNFILLETAFKVIHGSALAFFSGLSSYHSSPKQLPMACRYLVFFCFLSPKFSVFSLTITFPNHPNEEGLPLMSTTGCLRAEYSPVVGDLARKRPGLIFFVLFCLF